MALAALVFGIPAVDAAGEVGMGSPDFRPSAERPVGWRGDGSGKYPAAEPPIHWGRVAKSMRQLRAQAARPGDGETGKPIDDGIIREWLILGPVPVPDELKKLDKDVLPDEAGMAPGEGDKVGDLTWRKSLPDSQTVDFRTLFGVLQQTQAVLYAHAYLYCENAQNYHMNVMSSGHRLFVNGAPPKGTISLQKGWNRMLFRVQPAKLAAYGSGPEPVWYLRSMLFGASGSECETENIAWSTRLPSWGISSPIIVGDRIFVTGERRSLYCLNKSDGKLLWMRTLTLYDVATDEEKKANPEVFLEIAPLAAKLAELDRSIKPGTTVSNDLISAKSGTEEKIMRLMAKVDRRKYAIYPPGEGGVSAPTATSDGQNVFVAYLPYLTACFDLSGNMQWVKMHEMCPPYNGQESHGMYSSPVLLDGKLIVNSDRLFALDAKTGNLAWQTNEVWFYASLLSVTMDKAPLLVTPSSVIRARDGRTLSFFEMSSTPSPVIGDGRIFRFGADTIRLPASPVEPFRAELEKSVVVDARWFPKWYCGSYSASPLYHEGLLYAISEDGVLSVMDTEKREVLYQRLLDLDLEMSHGWAAGPARGGACSSPALAGKYIYFFGNRGTCVVIKPGRTFQQVARNRLETPQAAMTDWGHPEQTISCPVFEGKRLYIRALENLHCIE